MPELLVDFITSLDGYGAADGWPGFWGLEGPEYLAWLEDQPEADYTVLMGPNTYRLMSGLADEGEPGTEDLAGLSKVVFSSSLSEPLSWPNTRLVSEDPVEAVREMKAGGDTSIRTMGSLTLCRSLLKAGLVDRFRVVVFPVITGKTGRDRIYDGYPDVALEMVSSRTFDGRLQLLEYVPRVVSSEEWLAARRELLAKEKELTRMRDRVNADRRRLPMVRIDKPYAFEGPDGKVGLLDLFEGRQQLVMHHFMWINDTDADGTEHPRDAGCPSCSSAADGIGNPRQLHVRNTTLDDRVAPVLLHFRTEAELAEAGTPWTSGPWTESMRGAEFPGISAFLRVGEKVFHTYSTFGRGIEEFHNGYRYLDLTALGRQEAWEEPKGRAVPLGLQVGGPAMRVPDEYDT